MVLTENEIRDIRYATKIENLRIEDIAFNIVCEYVDDKDYVHRMIYGKGAKSGAERIYSGTRNTKIRAQLVKYGILGVGQAETEVLGELDITRAENKAELIKMLPKIKEMAKDGTLDAKDAIQLEKDIRFKLNDKFEMEDNAEERRIIVVPQKHDMVCPHTHKECTNMPSERACCEYYGLRKINSRNVEVKS